MFPDSAKIIFMRWFGLGVVTVGLGVFAACGGQSQSFTIVEAAGAGGSSAGSTANASGGGLSKAGSGGGGSGHGGSTGARGGRSNNAGRPASTAGKGGTGNLDGDAGADNGGVNEGETGGTGGTGNMGGTAGIGGEGGMPGTSCDAGFATCPGSPGCSTRLEFGNAMGSTVVDCGACGRTCSLDHATNATCNAGACQPTCETNFGDCNATRVNDGCETELTTAANCGGCGRTCSREGANATTCNGGSCAPSCAAKYADCNAGSNSGPDDGCETYLDSLSYCGTACTGGVPCNINQVCNAGTCVAADGLIAMSIPFTDSGQGQRFADKFTDVNLADSTLMLRVYAPGATNGYMNTYLVDTSFHQGPLGTTQFTTLSAGWTDVVVRPGAATASFDPTHVYEVTIEFYTKGSGPWANPTVIYLDGVRSSNLAVNDTFDATTGNMVSSSLMSVSGSSYAWTAAMP